MKIPDKINICGQIISVVIDDKLLSHHSDIGQYHKIRNEITIDSNINQDTKESVFIHEIVEAICFMNDIELEHQTISTISNQLYQVLSDNNLLRDS